MGPQPSFVLRPLAATSALSARRVQAKLVVHQNLRVPASLVPPIFSSASISIQHNHIPTRPEIIHLGSVAPLIRLPSVAATQQRSKTRKKRPKTSLEGKQGSPDPRLPPY